MQGRETYSLRVRREWIADFSLPWKFAKDESFRTIVFSLEMSGFKCISGKVSAFVKQIMNFLFVRILFGEWDLG